MTNETMTLEEQIGRVEKSLEILTAWADESNVAGEYWLDEKKEYEAILASLKELQELREREEDYKSTDINTR